MNRKRLSFVLVLLLVAAGCGDDDAEKWGHDPVILGRRLPRRQPVPVTGT